MESDHASEGLFLRNYLGTVSAISRSRTLDAYVDLKSNATANYRKCQKFQSQSLDMSNCTGRVRVLPLNSENENVAKEKKEEIEVVDPKKVKNHELFVDDVHVENEDEKQKKKEKKWTLGVIFRKKGKKDADDSSDHSDDDQNKSFLSRRKSKKEKRKLKARSTANGFDVIIPQRRGDVSPNSAALTAEQELWSKGPKSIPAEDPAIPQRINGSVRFIQRHSTAIPNDTLKIKKNSQQVPKHFRSVGGSENWEGKKGRKEVMARVEAKRDMLHDESSSDENDSYNSNSSLNKPNPDQGPKRPRRPDRHRRFLKEEDCLSLRENDVRVIKSDFEGGRRLPSGCRWISRSYPDSSDHETVKLSLINHSGTPSPCRSPRVRSRQLLHYMQQMPNSYPTSTFPPGIHHQHSRMMPNQVALTQARNHNFTKEIPHYSNHRLVSENVGNKIQNFPVGPEYPHNVPGSLSSMEAPTNQKVDSDHIFRGERSKEKSLSYDYIHRTTYSDNEPSECCKKFINFNHKDKIGFQNFIRQKERFLKNDKMNSDEPRATLKNYRNETVANRTDSSCALSERPGIFPHQPFQVVRRSASGHSFCSSPEGFLTPNRSRLSPNNPNDMYYWSPDDEISSKNATNTQMNNYCFSKSEPYSEQDLELFVSKPNLSFGSSILRYYADQNPRSRNPIHITCNPMSNLKSDISVDSPCLNDFLRSSNSTLNDANAPDFRKLKFQNKNNHKEKNTKSLPFQYPQVYCLSDTPRANNKLMNIAKIPFEAKYSNERGSAVNDWVDDLICSEHLPADISDRKTLKEIYNLEKVNVTPPDPPVRRLSKQEVLERLHKCEQLKNKEVNYAANIKSDPKANNSNLDEALSELESIYNSLKLKDEDLVDRAERRDLPALRFSDKNLKEYSPVSARDGIHNFYAETDFSHKLMSRTGDPIEERQKALPLRKSVVPDKTTDDMAFRRMNSRGRSDVKKLPSQSYLKTSPALSPVFGSNSELKNISSAEPDVTYDDVVFRSIRHSNSTLKIQDPQPPFGIPIGVVPPAPNSDYLHAKPKERFRPTFISSKTPDIVKDDLAFRNLRKDKKIDSVVHSNKSDENSFLKKRAIRSLSANLYNIMQTNRPGSKSAEINKDIVFGSDSEKTQSLTDLTNGKWTEKQAFERKLKELKDEKVIKKAEFFETSQKLKNKKTNLSWTDLANLNGNFESILDRGNNGLTFSENVKKSPLPEKKSFRFPVVELSKYPAAAPSSSLQGNPFKELPSGMHVDEDQLEELLSSLAVEAKNTSRDLESRLNKLQSKNNKFKSNDLGTDSKEKLKEVADQMRYKAFKPNTPDKAKRRRNLSLSNSVECKEETRKTNSLERKKEKKGNNELTKALQIDDFLSKKTKEIDGTNENDTRTNQMLDLGIGAVRCSISKEIFSVEEGQNTQKSSLPPNSAIASLPKNNSSPFLDNKKRHSRPVDLSEISLKVETEQRKNASISAEPHNEIAIGSEDVFQEIYKYNCLLPDSENQKSDGNEKLSGTTMISSDKVGEALGNLIRPRGAKIANTKNDVISDVEREFERLHQEEKPLEDRGKSIQETFAGEEVRSMDYLIADKAGTDQSSGHLRPPFPFPREGSSSEGEGSPPRAKGGTSFRANKEEGIGPATSRNCDEPAPNVMTTSKFYVTPRFTQ